MNNLLFNKRLKDANDTVSLDIDLAVSKYIELEKDVRNYYSNKDLESFYNTIDYIIYLNLYPDKKIKLIEEPLYLLYYFMGLAYEKKKDYLNAKESYDKSLKMNIFFYAAFMKKVYCFNKENDLENMYNLILDSYKYIYKIEDLVSFYNLLGEYYISKEEYITSSYIYSYINYLDNDSKKDKIEEIENHLNIKVDYSLDSIKSFLKKNNIPITIDTRMINILKEVYSKEVNSPFSKKVNAEVKKILFKITNDDVYSPSLIVDNKDIGFSFNLPDSWKIVSRKEYPRLVGEIILYIIKPNDLDPITISLLSKTKDTDLKKCYDEIRKKILYNGFLIINESIIKIKGNQFIQCFVEKKINGESIIEVHNYNIINNNLIDFKMNIDLDNIDLHKLYNNKNIIKLNVILSSISITSMSIPKNEEFSFI